MCGERRRSALQGENAGYHSAMPPSAQPANLDDVQPWRQRYRREMNCQIVHDSLHRREGWTRSWLLLIDGAPVGHGSVAVGGPWNGKPAVFEFYVEPQHRPVAFDLFAELLAAGRPSAIESQTNDPLLAMMLHTFCKDVRSERILFPDAATTALSPPGARFRPATAADQPDLEALALDKDAAWVVEVDGSKLAAAGGIMSHYNPPYRDVYMAVAEPFRRRGLGSFLVQELKRVCYRHGHSPAARCRTDNHASRRTLQRAGFLPCGHLLTGLL